MDIDYLYNYFIECIDSEGMQRTCCVLGFASESDLFFSSLWSHSHLSSLDCAL
jgi:hypothetical protein